LRKGYRVPLLKQSKLTGPGEIEAARAKAAIGRINEIMMCSLFVDTELILEK
jgi:hypothetical protein